jgi:hypothetical protein
MGLSVSFAAAGLRYNADKRAVSTGMNFRTSVYVNLVGDLNMLKQIAIIVAFASAASGALAQDRSIGTYMAYLGPEDLVNSSGTRLNSAAAIVAQDRANFHRFGVRHAQDEPDPWFASRGHRMAILDLVQVSNTDARIIVRQGALVAVTVFADPTGQMTRMLVQIPG